MVSPCSNSAVHFWCLKWLCKNQWAGWNVTKMKLNEWKLMCNMEYFDSFYFQVPVIGYVVYTSFTFSSVKGFKIKCSASTFGNCVHSYLLYNNKAQIIKYTLSLFLWTLSLSVSSMTCFRILFQLSLFFLFLYLWYQWFSG